MNLEKYNIILSSNSPRRKELLAGLDLKFTVDVLPNVDESYPPSLNGEEIPIYIAEQKANAYCHLMKKDDLLITADTIVLLNNKVYGKPTDLDDAKRMLHELSGKTHQVITGICIMTLNKTNSFAVTSSVRFSKLAEEDINYYVEKYKPLDKAGAYGIQEWIGYVGVEYIEGSYFNVMGLPVQRLHQELIKF